MVIGAVSPAITSSALVVVVAVKLGVVTTIGAVGAEVVVFQLASPE
jgi:hypothetical protein